MLSFLAIATRLSDLSATTVVDTLLLIPYFDCSGGGTCSKIVFLSDSSLTLPPVMVVFVTPCGARRSSGVPLNCELFFLLHHCRDARPFEDSIVALSRGRRVAMQPAVIPIPTSTVVQMAKSVVR